VVYFKVLLPQISVQGLRKMNVEISGLRTSNGTGDSADQEQQNAAFKLSTEFDEKRSGPSQIDRRGTGKERPRLYLHIRFDRLIETSAAGLLPDVSVFLGTFAKLRKATISFVTSVRLCAWKNAAPTGRIFMKRGI
jgi:hypothetical protein